MKIIHTLGEETNVFVISHKAELEDASNEGSRFVKDKNFSKIKNAERHGYTRYVKIRTY